MISGVVQRYYSSQVGRFLTPDPYTASGGPADPQSWNRYSYTRGDPVNRTDRTGLEDNGPSDLVDCGPYGTIPEGACELFVQSTGVPVDSFPSPHPASARAQARWDKAQEKLSDANDLLHRLQPNADCQKDLNALLGGIGKTLSDVQLQADISDWQDATTSTALVKGLYTQGTKEYDFWASKAGFTISDLLRTSPDIKAISGLAISGLSGKIFFDPRYVNGHSAAFDAALLMHETMHSLGLVDGQLLTALGYTADEASGKVTTKLARDCFGVQ